MFLSVCIYCIYKYAMYVYVIISFSDDWAGFALARWLIFPWPVEHSGLHSCCGSSGSLCSHVSQMNLNMRYNKLNFPFCWYIWKCLWSCLAALLKCFVIHFQIPLMPCDNYMTFVRKKIQAFQNLDTHWCLLMLSFLRCECKAFLCSLRSSMVQNACLFLIFFSVGLLVDCGSRHLAGMWWGKNILLSFCAI